jgi:hypothetical protein
MKRTSLRLLFVACLIGFFSQCLPDDELEYARKDAHVGGSRPSLL